MKNNSLFAHMNSMLYLMLAANNIRIKLKSSYLDEESKDYEMEADKLIEQTIDNQERLEKMIDLNIKIENISKQMNATYIYKVESNIYNDYDGDVLNFALLA